METGVEFTDIYVDEEIIESVGQVLRGKRYVKGPETERFEDRFAAACDVEHGVGVSSGTAAILLALKAIGIGPGDEVLVPGHTFFATVSPVLALGARPVFVDIDPETYTVDPDSLESATSAAENPRAVLPVHIYGQPADMDAVQAIADEYDLWVVEDSCQAHLAAWDGKNVGALGDVGCFSFYPSKNMTVAGDGGMLVTDDGDIAETARRLRNHGRTEDGVHENLGLNYRLDEINSVFGQKQLEKLPQWNERRRDAAGMYTERLQKIDQVTTPTEADSAFSVYHLYVIQAIDRDGLKAYLEEERINTGIHYETPAHHHPAVRERLEPPELPETEALCDRILSLPMHPGLTTDEIEYVCDSIGAYYK